MTIALAGLISTAFTGGASDVFLVEGEKPRVRTDGEVIVAHGEPLDHDSIAEIWKSCGLDPNSQNDGDASLEVPGAGRLRLNAYRTLGRLALVMRPIKEVAPSFDELGLPGDLLTSWLQRRSGLILFSGPTGSGKSPSVAACLDWINKNQSRHIVTIEDPIEFVYSHSSCLIKQREIGHDTRSFPVALRQALRQDPDVIVVSELRDLETIRIALTAAETGHLVLATLHTLDAPQSIDRLVDVFPADQQAQIITQLASVVEGIVSQRLISRADGQGRVLASEILRANHGIRACTREKKFEQIVGLMEIGHQDGNRTIDQSIASLLQQGYITREEALFHARDQRNFAEAEQAKKPTKSIWT